LLLRYAARAMNHVDDSSSQYVHRALPFPDPFPLITSASSPRSQAVLRLSASGRSGSSKDPLPKEPPGGSGPKEPPGGSGSKDPHGQAPAFGGMFGSIDNLAATRQAEGYDSGAATALPSGPPAKVCLVRANVALCSAYPRAILSLPSAYPLIPFRSMRRRRRRGCRRWRAWRRVCSSPRRPWRPVAPHAASGDGGGSPACPQPILSLPSAYPLILSYPARGDGGGGDAAADELDGDFARGISAAPGGLRSPMPLEATQAEALHTCRTVYSLILSCRLVALLLLAVRVMASGAKKSSQAQERRCQEERRRKDLRPRYAECERQQSAP
jgi:hypothetical protein